MFGLNACFYIFLSFKPGDMQTFVSSTSCGIQEGDPLYEATRTSPTLINEINRNI